jgi:hypothetical protein
VYFGYVIGGGDLKVDSTKMDSIMKSQVPKNVSGVGETQYLRKLIASFLAVVAPLHSML